MSGSPAEPSRKLDLIDPSTGQRLSGLQTWMAVAVMVFGTSFMSLVVVALAPILPELASHLGEGRDGKFISQIIQVAPSIGVIFGAPLSGWLVERIGSRRFLLAIFILFGLAGSAGLYLDGLWLLGASRLVLGVAAAGIVTATLYMIGEYFDAEGRARILGYQSAVGAIAAMSFGIIAGFLADAGGWRAPFFLYLLAFPLVAVAWLAFPRGAHRRPPAKSAAAQGSIAALLPLLALVVVFFVGSYMSNVQIPFLLDDDGVTKPSLRSLVVSASAAMVALGSATFGAIRNRIGDRWTLRLAGGLMGIGIVWMGLAESGELAAVGCAISGLGIGIMNPQVNNLLISRAGPEARGRAAGLGYTARYLGNFLNPVLVHPLAVAFGIHWAFILVGGVFVAGTLLDMTQRPRAVASVRS